jgi:hypothetical protein
MVKAYLPCPMLVNQVDKDVIPVVLKALPGLHRSYSVPVVKATRSTFNPLFHGLSGRLCSHW